MALPRIVGAALKHGDLIIAMPKPARHHDIIHRLHALAPGSSHRFEQGFLLDTGTFLGRAGALQLALDNGQVKEPDSPPQLFSEDLW